MSSHQNSTAGNGMLSERLSRKYGFCVQWRGGRGVRLLTSFASFKKTRFCI
ncbi:hypothetical protein DPMN_015153 [Dreissena polymorpha]|uniref:Uncharacterized protein n=1 Tax=Dreissena polymorpha TaxID=45954 RepID=A0A9D4S5X1_DREPO|nr:hypothetical protein DPMN_015153 [Dreissena polymorpha]